MYKRLVGLGQCQRQIQVSRCLVATTAHHHQLPTSSSSGCNNLCRSQQQPLSNRNHLLAALPTPTKSTTLLTLPSITYSDCSLAGRQPSRSLHTSRRRRSAASTMDTDPPPLYTNKLALEKSTYLLQHAHNPVNWYPWGDEAIELARTERKLIFLSVGYSTCHWCHVMEHESFENPDIAAIMNEHYVCIKVDREERPDLDRIYMNFVVMVNGSGGWPMSVWLTPDLAPISAGTYFPPVDRWGTPGFGTVLQKVQKKWVEDAQNLTRIGLRVIDVMKTGVTREECDDERQELCAASIERKFEQAVQYYFTNVDPDWGGFGRSPKFPEVSKLKFVLHASVHQADGQLLAVAVDTLQKIAEGGIHDHVCGGFSRYSVDRKWHVPHFEKMLYDQGQLMNAYATVYKILGDESYREVADGIFEYVCRDLRHPEGAFFSGEDADSLPSFADTDKVEGAFYAWDWQELKDVFQLNREAFVHPRAFELVTAYFGCTEEGNVDSDSDPHGVLHTKNILMIQMTMGKLAEIYKTDVLTAREEVRKFCDFLAEERAKRPRPLRDSKIISGWNGLMLSGLAKLASVSGLSAEKREEYLEVGAQLVAFLRKHAWNAERRTLHRTCYEDGPDGEGITLKHNPIEGFLDDYAFVIRGLLDYYLACGDVAMLHWARELQAAQDHHFWDDVNHGYYYSQADSPNVVARLKDDHDGAEPAGNSIAAGNLLRLAEYFDDEEMRTKLRQVFELFSTTSPFGLMLPEMLSAMVLFDTSLVQVVIVGASSDPIVGEFEELLRGYYMPGVVMMNRDPTVADSELLNAKLKDFQLVAGKAAVYICLKKVCSAPVTDVDTLRELLDDKFLFKCE